MRCTGAARCCWPPGGLGRADAPAGRAHVPRPGTFAPAGPDRGGQPGAATTWRSRGAAGGYRPARRGDARPHRRMIARPSGWSSTRELWREGSGTGRRPGRGRAPTGTAAPGPPHLHSFTGPGPAHPGARGRHVKDVGRPLRTAVGLRPPGGALVLQRCASSASCWAACRSRSGGSVVTRCVLAPWAAVKLLRPEPVEATYKLGGHRHLSARVDRPGLGPVARGRRLALALFVVLLIPAASSRSHTGISRPRLLRPWWTPISGGTWAGDGGHPGGMDRVVARARAGAGRGPPGWRARHRGLDAHDFANSAFAAVRPMPPTTLAVVGNEPGGEDLWWGRVVSVSMGLVADVALPGRRGRPRASAGRSSSLHGAGGDATRSCPRRPAW
jgi:hypothetical protein